MASPTVSPSVSRDASPVQSRDVSPVRGVAFEEVPKKKISALEEAMMRHAEAKKAERARLKKAKEQEGGDGGRSGRTRSMSISVDTRNHLSNPFELEKYRTLDSVKALPKRSGSRLHASGARTADSVSRASTSLTVRSTVQIKEDRTFKSGFSAEAADLQKPTVIAQRLDLKPLDVEGGGRGIGKGVTKAWQGKLREIKPNASSGEPVANNALARGNVNSTRPPPGFFSQVPERLGKWRDDFAKIDTSGSSGSANGPCVGQWVPEALVRRREKEAIAKERKAAADAEKRIRQQAEFDARSKILREKEDADRRAEQIREAQEKAEAEETARRKAAAAARKAENEKKKRMNAPSMLTRQSTKTAIPIS